MVEHDVALRFRGDGTLRIPGVPLRDLTTEDLAALRPEVLREVKASSLYTPVKAVAPVLPPVPPKKDGE